MALVLTLKPKERILIGENSVAYVEQAGEDRSVIRLNVDGEVFEITDLKKTEILPEVLVSAGEFNEQFQQYRLLFDAPRRITILREELLT